MFKCNLILEKKKNPFINFKNVYEFIYFVLTYVL